MVAGSSSRLASASSSVPVYEPLVEPVASPSFATDLNYSGGGEVGIGDSVPTSLQCAAPAGLGDALLDDSDDDDVEPDIIADDSGDDIGASEPAGAGSGSSSGTQQYPPHFSSLDLDAMRQKGVPGEPAGFGARDAEGSAGLTEFQDKDEAVLSVKTYSIRRGVQYKVVESDYRQDDASVTIKVLLNATAAHFGFTFIMPMVRVDAFVSIKVLLNTTAAHFGFRLTYRRVWLAKQKAVAHIYGDWDESYNKLPRWVLGVQLTMPGTVAVLRTSPVRVGGQVDESQAYFHRLFWTFPPCIEAFRHCKSLVSIDGIHLYARDPATGLLVISDRHNGIKATLEAPDGGWLPPAAYRAFCIRHVAANFALTFKGKDAKRLLVNAAYAKTEVEFNYWFDILRSEDPAMCE
ncbi:uncharacterized protein LOC107646446 [Arachis ipaensis]|uniref:uncharacterized protein LOC107646446 n=1 Tax=Arachis ipaensis TaxID=130454 RepID=UPI0007AEF6D1|nr:uncharacterized protein LOC107646446 [Arachis ipaensis]